MATRQTRREYFGDNLWRDVPVLGMDAAPQVDEDDEDERDHQAAMREALDAYRDARERRSEDRRRGRDGGARISDDRRGGRDTRRGRDSDNEDEPGNPTVYRGAEVQQDSRRRAHDAAMSSRNARLFTGASAGAARDAFPALGRFRM